MLPSLWSDEVGFWFLRSMFCLFWSLQRTVRDRLRLAGCDAALSLSSVQLWLLEMAPTGTRPSSGLLGRCVLSFGGLSDVEEQGRSGLLLEVVVWGLCSGDRRWPDSKPEEDLTTDEDLFLPPPEINK